MTYLYAHVFESLCDFIVIKLFYERKPLRVTEDKSPVNSGCHRHCGGENVFLIFQMISQDHVFL